MLKEAEGATQVRADRRPLTSEVASNCDLCEQLGDRETVKEMTAERLVLFVRDSGQEQVGIDYQVDEGEILCVA